MNKILIIVNRYGLDVVGGAELHARWLSEHLKERGYEIEVATTCANDYVTWKNEYLPGEEEINGIKVRRFVVDKQRDKKKYPDIETRAFYNTDNLEYGEKWEREQGPYSTSLLRFLKQNKNDYSHFIYFSYLYATTYFGIQITPREKNIIVPLAHKELSLYTKVIERVFHNSSYIIYNTEEEKKLLLQRMPYLSLIQSSIAGVGINEPKNIDEMIKNKKYEDYLIYAGRIDEAKGCNELFTYFQRFKHEEPEFNIKLVLIGKDIIKIPTSKNISYLGFVSEEKKFELISNSKFLIVPSEKESLSMTLLESLLCETPVLVNAKCDVLKAHVLKGNCGLWYSNYEEFRECIKYLSLHKIEGEILGKNGKKYVKENYDWEIIMNKYDDILQK